MNESRRWFDEGTGLRRRGMILAGAFVVSGTAGCGAPEPSSSDSAAVTPAGFTADAAQAAFLDTVQRRTFDWFWETTNPRNGLVPDRWPTKSFSSIAAVGFGLTAYAIGVERGWITREQARGRVLTTLEFFWRAPQGTGSSDVTGYRGFFYHFLDMETGHRFRNVELSTIDTGLLLAGVLFCREYFDRDDAGEARIRTLADSIYFRVDWQWARDGQPSLSMGWHPPSDRANRGFIASRWIGYNEAMLLYAMAVGSPTFPIEQSSWQAWTSGYRWDRFHGQEFVQFAPLFGHQYSHAWIDFRGIQDAYMRGKGIDYFENSRRVTLSQRAYAVANPGGWRDYSANEWGLTASDGPLDTTMTVDGRSRQFHTYWARGAGGDQINDDGTIAPTAAGGSVPFAPEIAIPALMAMRQKYGDHLFGRYGFLDAFNATLRSAEIPVRQGRIIPSKSWVDSDYLGIDQGPILIMIENYRTDLVWRYMRKSPFIVRGLCGIGFRRGWLAGRCPAP
ncbi:MAG TPA: glucoamylase family protein [Gemmatimonadaceae bacterium]|nr:glucoamylase family protein [Gemmatimonadaceae bacterium]